MKALVKYAKGNGNMEVRSIPEPVPGPGQVKIEVKAAGICGSDLHIYHDDIAIPVRPPVVTGHEFCGVIAEVGEGVEGLAVGDRVVTPGNQGLGERGSYAEYVRAAAERVIKLPDHISMHDAATLPTAGMTAWEATMDVGQTRSGQTVVVNGGAGGTGSFAIQIAKMAGARVATTCSPRNFDYVASLGADHAINYREGDIVEQIMEKTKGKGVDRVIIAGGNVDTMIQAVAMLKPGGRVGNVNYLGTGDFVKIPRLE